ncbi:MAG TPA: transporter substrate-binding domain-containing protein [Ruminiclostridium sp.]|nr:transporter substrate-binding domain-containing protein [Ruminiclostridium sp.]
MKNVKRVLIIILNFLLVPCLISCSGTDNASVGKPRSAPDDQTIRIGILLSTTGSTAVIERSMLNAAYLAFDEINKAGGIGGKKIKYIQEDYCSDPTIAAKKMEDLIVNEKVVATVGCCTSASRQATFGVLEKYNSLLVYPTFTEGEEINPHVIYTGAMPNQQTTKYLPWLMNKLGKRVFLIGNDYVFSVICNKQAKRMIEMNKGTICGEEYAPIGTSDFTDILNKIKKAKPDFIYCDLVGDSVTPFYKEYKQLGFNPARCPIAAIATDEMSLQGMGADCAEGHYASMNYFSTLDTSASREFVKKYTEYSHDGSLITSSAEATYDSCYLLAKAIGKAKDPYDTDSLIKAFSGLTFDAPQGKIKVDASNHCTWLYSRFAIVHNGKFQIVYESKDAIRPEPWPAILYPGGAPG